MPPAYDGAVPVEQALLDSLWDFSDAAGSEARLRDAAAAAASAGLTFLHVDALHMLAIADPEHADEWTDAALAALEDVDEPRTLRWRVSLYNNLGWWHADSGRPDEALAAFEASRDAAERWGTPQQVAWADEAIAEVRGDAGDL